MTFLSVKAGNEFILYQLPAPATEGVWSTAGLVNHKGIMRDVSHITLWRGRIDNMRVAVPEPSAWALMILGFGGVGAVLRRRRTLVAA